MPDYSKTVFYKYVCKDKDIKDFKIGFTTNFKQIKQYYKNNYDVNWRHEKENKINPTHAHIQLYRVMDKTGGFDNWELTPFKIIECKDKIDATIKWEKMKENLKPELNNLGYHNIKHYLETNKVFFKKIDEKIKNKYEPKNKELRNLKSEKWHCVHCNRSFLLRNKTHHEKGKYHKLNVEDSLNKNDTKEIEWGRCDGCSKHELSCRCGVGSPWY